jgi:secondary thiamine-phosphate synthase enzyme
MMYVHQESIHVGTKEQGFTNITEEVGAVVLRGQIRTGMCTVFIQHTSASLVIQENADPAVLRDLQRWMAKIAPESKQWEHADEGPDDMPAHLRCAMTRTSEQIPVTQGALALGQWQGLYLWEHRIRGGMRRMVVHVAGIGWDDQDGI